MKGTAGPLGALVLWNDCKPGHEADYEAWYRTEHLPERLAVPGFLVGRRYQSLGGTPRFFTYYLTTSPAVLTSAAYVARGANPTAWTTAVMSGAFTNMNRNICAVAATAGSGTGGHVVTARFLFPPPAAAIEKSFTDVLSQPGAVRATHFARLPSPNSEQSTEERLRGRDANTDHALMVDCLREEDTVAVAELLAGQFGAMAQVGRYRLLMQLDRADIVP